MSWAAVLEAWELSYLPIVILASLTAIIINITLMALGKAFYLENVERFAKTELAQTFATVFMSIFLVSLLALGMNTAGTLLAGEARCPEGVIRFSEFEGSTVREITGEGTPINNAFEFIRCKLAGATQTAAARLDDIDNVELWMLYYLYRARFGLMGIPIYDGQFGLFGSAGGLLTGGEGIGGSVYGEIEKRRFESILYTTLLIGLNAQHALISYIEKNALTFFLPLGILLRTFYITRPIGGMFIALALAFYFVFPVVFVMLDPSFVPAPPEKEEPPLFTQGCVQSMSGFATTLSSFSALPAQTKVNRGNVKTLSEEFSSLYVQLLIHPLLSISLTIMIAGYLMSILDSDPFVVSRFVTKVVR